MKKAFNICSIIFVLFSQFFCFPHNQVKAEESIGNTLFDSVEMKDENGHIINEALNPNNKVKPGSTIQLEYTWSMKTNQVIHANDTVALAVPNQLKVKTDTQGNVMVDQTNIGQFFVTANDNKIKLVFNDQVENVKDSKGKIKFETVFNPSVQPDAKSVQIVFPLGKTSQSISVPIATDTSQNTASNTTSSTESNTQNITSNTAQPQTTAKSNEVTDTTPKQITENILTGVILTDKNGQPFNDTDNRPNTDSPANIYFDWEIPGSLHVKEGDYYTFTLPKQFIIYNTVTGDLVDEDGDIVGTFVVTKDGQVTMTFNKNAENDPNLTGKLELHTEFNKETIKGSTQQEIVFPLKDKDASVTVDFKPNVNQSTDKSGLPNKSPNADQIAWTVNVNKEKDTLTNAIVKDPMPPGLSLNSDSIKVYYLDVDVDGNTKLGAEANPNDYTIISKDGSNLEIAFKDKINQAYQIQYTTKITDDTVTKFDNKVTVSSDNAKDQTASASVTVSHGKHLDKTSTYDPKTQTVIWTVVYNGDEKTIKHGDAILKDLFDNTHQLVTDSIEVKKATYDDQGKLIAGDTITDYTVTPTTDNKKNGFDLQFNTDINNAYIITYKTKATGNVINDGKVTNTVTADGNSSSSNTANFTQQNIIKSNVSTDYKDKTTTWSIVINDNNYEMNNAVITDSFASGGLTLQNGSFKIHDNQTGADLVENTDYTLNVTSSGFTVTLIGSYAKTTNTLVITYTTTFDYSKISNGQSTFKNTADVTWKDENGNDQNSSSTATFDPDWYTKFNGFKYGSYNAETKEITWQIGVNYNNLFVQDPSISDVLQDGQKLVPGSVEVHHLLLTGGAHGYEIGGIVPADQYSIENPTDKNGNTLTVHFNQSINSSYYITFKTTIDGELIKDRYDNTAILKDGSTNVSEIPGAVSVNNGGKFVTKKAQQDDNYINWSVSINESQSTLAHAKITDNPTDNQILVADSFHLYPTKVDTNGYLTKDTTNELKQGIDYTIELTTDNDTGKQKFELTFLKTIDRAYILEYKSLINAGNGEKVSNAVKLSADRITTENVETFEEIEVKVSSGSGTGSSSKGDLEIKKIDAADKNKSLAGAEFTLYDSTGKTAIRTITTDDTGIVKFNNLRYGDYLLKETKAPKGYLISEELKNGKIVTINSKSNNNYTLENDKYVGKAVLTKTDKESGETLEGAVFTLQDQNGNVIPGYEKLTTDDKGQLTANNLQPGNYQLVEVTAPANYDLDGTPIPFTIAENQTTVIKLDAKNSLTKGSVELTKVDTDDKHALEGAVFTLQDKDGKDLQKDLITDKDGKIVVKDLKPGDYQFVETKAPTHYDLNVEPIKFTIKKGQTKIAEVTATNSLTTGSVELTKVDADNNQQTLEGAVFSLQDKDGKDLQKDLTTSKDGKIVVKDLKPGDYQFVETKAPAGYDLNATPIKFTIEKGQTVVAQVTATNSLTKGGVKLTKLDEDGKTVLQDAVFSLQDKDGNELQKDLTTNKDGKIVVKDLKPGDYQFVETKAPAGYDLDATPIKFTIEKGQTKIAEVTAINNLTTGGVELTKIDADDKHALEGAIFSLQDKDGKELQKDLTTNKDGKIVVNDLKPGDYQFVETKAPTHYDLNVKPIKFTIEKGQTKVAGVTATNSLTTGGVELTKVDADDKQVLEGAVFSLQDKDGNELQKDLTTNKDGKIVVKDLKPGDYQFVETKAPAGYDLNATPIKFTIEKSQAKVIQVTAKNSLTTGGVELTKVDTDDKHALEGAVFSLQDKDGNELQKDLTTDKDGKIVVNDLKPGDYQFVEIKAPTHYDLNVKPIKFTIEKGQTKIAKVTAKNSLTTGSVELTKVDADNQQTLEGAVFSLQDKDGIELQKDLTTDKDGKIVVNDLKPGDYQFIETKAPANYDLDATPIKFTIEKGQMVVAQVTAKNNLTKGGVELTKLDEDGKTALQDAVFSLQDKDGNELQKDLTTNKDGKIAVKDLKPGDYQFVETKAPAGYDLDATPIKFTIEKGQTKIAEVTAINNLTTGSVELTKVDADNNQQTLEGAVFSLQDKDGNELQKDLTTDKDGKIVVKDLKPGDYQFVETKAPTGYDLDATPIKFTIEKGQTKIAEVTAINNLTTGSVELTKVDADNNQQTLEGAVFSLQDKDGNELQKDLTTDKDGKIVVKDLKPGDYQFIETKAPKGYQLNNSPVKFTVEKGQQNAVKVIVSNKKIDDPSNPNGSQNHTDDNDSSASKDAQNEDKTLPKTGHTDNHNTVTIGFILLLAGALSLAATRRKKDYR